VRDLSTQPAAVGFAHPLVAGAFQPVNDLAFCAGLKSQEQSYTDQEYDCYD